MPNIQTRFHWALQTLDACERRVKDRQNAIAKLRTMLGP